RRGADRDAEPYVLEEAEVGPAPLPLEECTAREREQDVVWAEKRRGPAGDVVKAVEVRRLELGHHADPSAGEVEDVLERRDGVLAQLCEWSFPEWAAERREPVEIDVVEDDEGAVGRDLDVELDEVRADGDRPVECREGVLPLLRRRAAVGDDPRHPTSDWTSSTSIASTMPSAAASRSSGCVPRTARQRRPAARADATPASVSSNATTSRGARPSPSAASART